MRFLLLLLFSTSAAAGDFWLTTGFWSKHTSHESTYYKEHGGYRENNTGIGGQYKNWTGGWFKNSMNRDSYYAMYLWRPVKLGIFSTGLAAGLLEGYEGPPVGLAPVASLEGRHFGFDLVFIPKITPKTDNTFALRLKGRF